MTSKFQRAHISYVMLTHHTYWICNLAFSFRFIVNIPFKKVFLFNWLQYINIIEINSKSMLLNLFLLFCILKSNLVAMRAFERESSEATNLQLMLKEIINEDTACFAIMCRWCIINMQTSIYNWKKFRILKSSYVDILI